MKFQIGDIVYCPNHEQHGVVAFLLFNREYSIPVAHIEWFDGGYYNFPVGSYYYENLKRVSS